MSDPLAHLPPYISVAASTIASTYGVSRDVIAHEARMGRLRVADREGDETWHALGVVRQSLPRLVEYTAHRRESETITVKQPPGEVARFLAAASGRVAGQTRVRKSRAKSPIQPPDKLHQSPHADQPTPLPHQ